MNAHGAWTLTVALALAPATAGAAGFSGIHFQRHDWELACDNTGTCRAAGYQDDRYNEAVSVLLTRRAGPGQPVNATLLIGSLGDSGFLEQLPETFDVSISIGGRDNGTLRLRRNSLSAELNDEQTAALLAALRGSNTIEWTAGTVLWELSGKGAAAVLLKMDEFQERLGTGGALYKPGNVPESKVPDAKAAPVVHAVSPSDKTVPLSGSARRALLTTLRATTPFGMCEDLYSPAHSKGVTVTRLSGNLALASTMCSLAPYNTSHAYWIINVRPPYNPRLVTAAGSGYAAGVISGIFKGRGIGDCMSSSQWTWNGAQFVLTESSSTGMCKAIAAGGAWELPTLVTEVRR